MMDVDGLARKYLRDALDAYGASLDTLDALDAATLATIEERESFTVEDSQDPAQSYRQSYRNERNGSYGE